MGSAGAAGSPGGVKTSGLIQPPLHARAALEIHEHAADPPEAVAFLRRVYPKLVAWHRYLVPSYDLTATLFDPRRYWRGPVWINTDWLIWRGLLQHGEHQLAGHVADSMLALVRQSGFREYFDPFTGAGYGSDHFAWSAALIVDLIERRRRSAAAEPDPRRRSPWAGTPIAGA